MIVVELSRCTDFCLSDSRSTAHQLVTSINSKHPSSLFAEVGNGRANFNKVYVLFAQAISQNTWRSKKIVLRLKKAKTCKDNIIEHFSCLKRNIRAQYTLNYIYVYVQYVRDLEKQSVQRSNFSN